MTVMTVGDLPQSPAAAMNFLDVRFDADNMIIESWKGKINGAGKVPALITRDSIILITPCLR